MANFCTRCGKPLQPGEVCSCVGGAQYQQQTPQYQQQAPQYQQQAPQYQQQYQQAPQYQYQQQYQQVQPQQNSGKGQLFSVLKELFSSPLIAGREYAAEGNFIYAMIFIAVQGVLTGIFAAELLQKLRSFILMIATLQDADLTSRAFMGYIEMPYFSSFFITTFLSIILSCILAGLVFLGHKIAKSELSFQQVLSLVSLRSLAVSVVTVFSMVVALFSYQSAIVAFVIFSLGNVIGWTVLCLCAPLEDERRNSKIVYMYIIAFIVFYAISTFIYSKCWTIYLPETLKMNLKELSRQMSSYKNTSSNPLKSLEYMFNRIF